MQWMRRIRGALGMGLTWALGWAIGGVLIAASSLVLTFLPWHYYFDIFDAPAPAMGIPGFVAGVLFSIVVGIAGRRRKFHEISLPQIAVWGALGGLLLSLVPVTMVALGLASFNPGKVSSEWMLTAIIAGPFMLFSSLSASGYLMLARMGKRESIEASEEVAGVK